MTTTERDEAFDVRFDGSGYLCIGPDPNPPTPDPVGVDGREAWRRLGTTHDRVHDALHQPGTLEELMERATCSASAVRVTLRELRKTHHIGASGWPRVYTLIGVRR